MTEDLDLLRQLRPSTDGPDPELTQHERDALMAVIEQTTTTSTGTTSSRHRRPRRVVAATIAVVGLTAAAGWAVFRADHTTSTEISCPDAIIDATSGDPLADCAALWRQQNETEPPPLAGYLNTHGGIEVIPADQTPPAGWEPLEDGFRQDDRLIALEAELDDWSRGLNSDCFAQDDAVELVERQLARLALTDWAVTTEGGAANGSTTCSNSYRHSTERRVIVSSNEREGIYEDEPFVALARRLSELMVGDGAECLTVDAATARAQAEAQQLGFNLTNGEIVFHTVPAPAGDARPTCARPTTNVGGRVEVTLRAVPSAHR